MPAAPALQIQPIIELGADCPDPPNSTSMIGLSTTTTLKILNPQNPQSSTLKIQLNCDMSAL